VTNDHAKEWVNMKDGSNFEEAIESQRDITFSTKDCDRLLKAVRDAYHQADATRYVELTITTLQRRTLTFLCRSKIPLVSSPTGAVDLRGDGILLWVVTDVSGFSNRMDEKHMAVLR
jgi:hypothetical protein